MPLSAGDRLGVYEITAEIGAGGMGIVYRARDTTLDRDVALKVLPDLFASDPERLARFEREAKVLASLNHPNIAAIYGIEKSTDTRALVLELVEGPTLADRIAQGPIPVGEALPIARQIAEALEAAHEAGVIHRDLKPANVKVKSDGMVKVLDFGLAKALEPEVSGDPSHSPTMTAAATRMGMIMGTAAYMSPEQAKGKAVDKRADVWAFGAVLYEMLTGQRAFGGADVSDTLALVLMKEPDWPALPGRTPAPLCRLMRRCLEKNAQERLRDIGDAHADIKEALTTPSAEAVPPAGVAPQTAGWRRAVPLALATMVVGSLLTGFTVWTLRPGASQALSRFVITPPAGERLSPSGFDPDVAISPDGTRIVYPGDVDGQRRLFVRSRDQLEAVALPGLGSSPRTPFISPDGNWVGFFQGGTLQKVSILGGPPVIICELPGGAAPRGASWGLNDDIIFATAATDSGLWRVAAGGGEPEELTTPDPEQGEVDHLWPEILPDSQGVLFTITASPIQNSQIGVVSVETRERKVLIQGGSNPRYSATGHLVYGVEGTLRAVRFDLDRLERLGDPVPVLDDVRTEASGAASFSLSRDGSLVYIPGGITGSARTLVSIDREGRATPLLTLGSGGARRPQLSPDDGRVALEVVSEAGERDIWIYDLERGTQRRLTFEGTNFDPIWTPDGTRITFASNRGGAENLFWKRADGGGEEELLLQSDSNQDPSSWSPDGGTLAFYERSGSGPGGRDIWVLSRDSGDWIAEPVLVTPFNERSATFSMDGQWLAYVSDESGRDEVYVQPFPGPGGQFIVSTDGGREPIWSADGRELFYRRGNQILAVPVQTEPTFTAGAPNVLFEGPYLPDAGPSGSLTYSVSSDGQRFLMIGRGGEEGEPLHLVLVLNWAEELNQEVPVN